MCLWFNILSNSAMSASLYSGTLHVKFLVSIKSAIAMVPAISAAAELYVAEYAGVGGN